MKTKKPSNKTAQPMRHYIGKKAVRSKMDRRALCRFFMPHSVPLGLTNEQVRICILLDLIRDRERQYQADYEGLQGLMTYPEGVPTELRPHTEKGYVVQFMFELGVVKYLKRTAGKINAYLEQEMPVEVQHRKLKKFSPLGYILAEFLKDPTNLNQTMKELRQWKKNPEEV